MHANRTLWPSLSVALLLAAVAAGRSTAVQPQTRPNVLFIAVDDLRPSLGCYGDSLARSPNIDRLAARSMLFNRAYCQQAVCSPSRNSFLTGRRPDTIRIYDLPTHFRTTLPDVVTLPQHFRESGYHTEGMGKIFHTGHGNYDDERSWSVPSWPETMQGPIPRKVRLQRLLAGREPEVPEAATRRLSGRRGRGHAYAAPDVPDNSLFDGRLADHAVERLRALRDRPFFLAVGFLKPHLPFIAPKRYWDLHDPQRLSLDAVRGLPKDAPPYAGNGLGELRQYDGIPERGPVPDELARTLVHGYYASVSYTDAQIGRVLDELDRLRLRENTIVVLLSDHGWHLGDHGLWAKHTNYERAVRSTLIVSAPGMKPGRTNALVEFVDIYPALCDLARLPQPAGLEGSSFVPLIANPKRPWKRAAFSQWPKNIPGQGPGMGHSIRTERYRLTEWTVPGTEYSQVELYDYEKDPDETVNLALRPEHRALAARLRGQLHSGWRAASSH